MLKIISSLLFGVLIFLQSGLGDAALAASTCDTSNFEGFFVGPDQKSTYAVTKQPLTWSGASALAKSGGGRLAVVTSPELNTAIFSNLSSHYTVAPQPSSGKKAWIDLIDPTNSPSWSQLGYTPVINPSRFSWADGFSSYTNWKSGQPDGYCTADEMAVNPDHNCYGEPWAAINTDGTWSDEGDHGTTPTTLKGVVEWPNTTLDCVQVVTPATQPVVTPLPGADTGAQWCTNQSKGNMSQCDDTADGHKLCPLDQSACVPVTVNPTCPTGGTLDTTLHECTATPTCSGGGSPDPTTGQCTSTTTTSVPAVVNATPNTCAAEGTRWDGLVWTGGNASPGTTLSWYQQDPFSGNPFTLQLQLDSKCNITHFYYYDSKGQAYASVTFTYQDPQGNWTASSAYPPDPHYATVSTPYGTFYLNNIPSYSCPTGVTGIVQGTQCVTTTTTTTTPTCPTGMAATGTTCTSTPSCGSGQFVPASNICYAQQNTCALGNYPCYQKQGDTTEVSPGIPMTYCSLDSCQSDTSGWVTTNDTTSGQNDKTNDGARDASGKCLGQIYLFNGTDMRCRVFDRLGMTASFAKLIAEIALSCTGAGAALAGALAVSGAMATAVANAVIQIAVNTAIDAATGQLKGGSQWLIQAGVTVVSSVAGGATSGATDSLGDTLSDAMASAADTVGASDGLSDALQNVAQQIGDTVQQYQPAIQQGFMGQYTETRCCYPEPKLSAACTSDEVKEDTKRGNGLCHVVGTYIASKMLMVDMVKKETSCCFSSKLGRIFHEKGRPQLQSFGLDGGWGTPRSPNCRGFTPEEFQSLDFSIIDLSEYEQDLSSKMNQIQPIVNNYMNSVGSTTTQMLQNKVK